MPNGYGPRDFAEVQLLAALASGARTAAEAAARTGRAEPEMQSLLDWASSGGLVTRLDEPGGAAYSLTPQGLQILGVAQEVDGAVDAAGRVDLAAAARLVMEE